MPTYSQTSDCNVELTPNVRARKKNNKYHFEDGNATFWVEDSEFFVHKYFFARDSKKIGKLLERSNGTPITLENTAAVDFERFLSILYPINFTRHMNTTYTTAEWASILTFADTWGFESIRDWAIEELDEMGTAVDKIIYGRRFGVLRWLEDAYVEVCERTEPLIEEEVGRMKAKDVVRIASTREKFLRESKRDRDERKRIVCDIFQLSIEGPTGGVEVTRSESDSSAISPRIPDSPLGTGLLPSTHPLHSDASTVDEYDYTDDLLDYFIDELEETRIVGKPDVQIINEFEVLLDDLNSFEFGSLSDLIITSMNECDREKTATLMKIARLVYLKAINNSSWSVKGARLCRKMMLEISRRIPEDVLNPDNTVLTGGQVFRIYLLESIMGGLDGYCSAALSPRAMTPGGSHAALEAMSQRLNLIGFIGELFRFSALTQRFVHWCVEKLLGSVKSPNEDDLRCLYQLLNIVGPKLDTPEPSDQMDVYFSRIQAIADSPDGSNIGFVVRDNLRELLQLRDNKWVP